MALLTLFAAYLSVLWITDGFEPGLFAAAAANIVPVALLGVVVRIVLRRQLFGRTPLVQLGAHIVLAGLFSILWFWLLMVLLGMLAGDNLIAFSVRPFLGPAAAWQLLQGLTIYACIALLCAFEAERLPRQAESVGVARAAEAPFRLFVKEGDEIRPLDPHRIVVIRGADDYSEVLTTTGTHLVRMSLVMLGERLGDRFIRVHRSHLVNVERIGKAEPAGDGRLLLHMENGELITTSRAGARLLRERII